MAFLKTGTGKIQAVASGESLDSAKKKLSAKIAEEKKQKKE
jgi:hypothetical protein